MLEQVTVGADGAGRWPFGSLCLQCDLKVLNGDRCYAHRSRDTGTVVLHLTCMIDLVARELSRHGQDSDILEMAKNKALAKIAAELALEETNNMIAVGILHEITTKGISEDVHA